MIDLLKYWLFTVMFGGTTFFITYFITKMIAAPYTGAKGKIPSWKFKIRSYRIHLHHWFLSGIASVLLIKYYTIFTFNEFVILLGGALGITIHGIRYYDDWKKIISKE